MKLETFIVQFFYNNKEVALENIGRFYMSPEISVVPDPDKQVELPAGSIRFEQDVNTKQDEKLVDFIVQQSRKIRPLASSDLESYSLLSKQFLNIGKPLIIPGIGSLLKNQHGQFEFTQGAYANTKIDLPGNQVIREKPAEDVSFATPAKEKSAKSNTGLYLLIAALLLSAGAVAYYFISNSNKDNVQANSTSMTLDTITKIDSAQLRPDSATLVKDSIKQKQDSIVALNRATVPDSLKGYTFKIVIKEYANKQLAESALKKLSGYGHKLILSPIDSVRYKLAIPMFTSLSDTLRAKDSLGKFFLSKTYVEL